MATLAGNTIASTYPLLLKIDSNGIDGTLRAVQDGDATDSSLSISTTAIKITGDGATDQVLIENTNAGADNAPDLVLYRNSSSPADSDSIGRVEFRGRNDNSQDVTYANLEGVIIDASDGTEDSRLIQSIIKGGSSVIGFKSDDTEFAINESGVDMDFRVEAASSKTHALFVEGSSGNVGIGGGDATTPDSKLHIEETTNGSNVEFRMRALNDAGAGRTALFTVDPDAQTLTLGGSWFVNDISNERVGIGTSSPTSILNVHNDSEGVFRVSNVVSSNTRYSEFAQNASGGVISLLDNGGNTGLQISSYGNSFFNGGNVGIGVTPETWDTDNNFKVLQAGTGAFFGGRGTAITNSQAFWGNNCYFDETNDRWEHIGNSEAALWEINDDGHLRYYNASAASDDSAVSFNTRFVIRNNGNTGVGLDAPLKQFHIQKTDGAEMRFSANATDLNDNDNIGTIQFSNNNDATGAIIKAVAAGDWATNDYPTDIVFFTTPDGGSDLVERVRIDSSGIIGIGVAPATYGLKVDNAGNSGIFAGGIMSCGSFENRSDLRLKENIEPLKESLSILNQLKPVTFNLKEEKFADEKFAGFIAQEVEELYPIAVREEETDKKHLSIKMMDMIALLTKSMQELSAKVTELENKLGD